MTVTQSELERLHLIARYGHLRQEDCPEHPPEMALNDLVLRALKTIEQERALLWAVDEDLGRAIEDDSVEDDRVNDAHDAIHAHLREVGIIQE